MKEEETWTANLVGTCCGVGLGKLAPRGAVAERRHALGLMFS